jgi:transcriptional regulator with XRE-family HTH domain
VFDPLAITLVIATNQAFKKRRKEDNTVQDTIHDTIHDTPQVDIDELSKEAGRIELEEIQKEKYTPTEEDLEKLEKVLEGNYPIWDKIHEEPISPTEDELKKLEELLDLQVKDDREDHEFFEREYYEIKEEKNTEIETEEKEVEQTQQVVEERQPKKLSYLNRSANGKSLRINRI